MRKLEEEKEEDISAGPKLVVGLDIVFVAGPGLAWPGSENQWREMTDKGLRRC